MGHTLLKTLLPLDKRVRSFTMALGVLLAFIAPGFLNNAAFAAQVTERSIQLSSSTKSATGVSYTIHFTPVASAGAFVIEFCSNSPFLNSTCTAPTGFSSASATSATSGFTDVTPSGANKIVVAGTITAHTPVSVVVDGITNPSSATPFYARIVSYDTKSNAQSVYTSTDSGAHVDDGSVAISISDTIGVTAAVLETMTFCVAKTVISNDCDLTGNSAPLIQLGQTVGSVVALTPGVVSTGTVNTQISTNAANGAIVNIKSSATSCGGLKRAGSPTACDIVPAQNTGVSGSAASFGVKTATATDGTGGSGAFEPISGTYYNNSTYAFRYVAGNTAGVTSPYGDPFLDTNDAPANNKNMELTFAASATNSTPAGSYSADVSLIATGKF